MKGRFIGQPIEVEFDQPPLLSKKPGCPDRFLWQQSWYEIVELLHQWHDYGRRGRMASNMQPAHAAVAAQRGSWGVGRFLIRVRVKQGGIFEIYYDRAPKDADRRQGGWFLTQELMEEDA
jgi:hypothetical protein